MILHSTVSDDMAKFEVFCLGKGKGYLIKGYVKTGLSGLKVKYAAANPPDYHLSVAGTALPFANSEIAFNPSYNKGIITTDAGGEFSFRILPPNSYYTCNGRQLIPPSLNLAIEFNNGREKVYHIPLNMGYRGRSLSGLPNRPDRSYDR